MIRGNWTTKRVTVKGDTINPGASQKVRNHSPTGFNWGYGGSGPAQLALALLMVFAGREFAERNYMDFKWQLVAKLPQEDFEMPVASVEEWIRQRQVGWEDD